MNASLPGTLLLDDDVIQNPYPFYSQLHREAPVWEVPGGEVFVVSAYALLAEATTRTESFSSNLRHMLYRKPNGEVARVPYGGGGVQTLATADPPVHTLHKATAFPNFALKRMALLETEITDIAQGCIAPAIAKGTVDFMTAVADRVPITVISRLIGFRNSNLDLLHQAALYGTDMLAGTISLEELQDFSNRTDNTSAWIATQIELTATEPDEDVLTAIGNGVRSGVLTVVQAVAMLHTFLSAGGESTTSLIGNAVRVLAEQQELQNQLRANADLIPDFLEEILRYESPFRAHMRSVPQDTTLGDVKIPAGATVLMAWGAANRDASVFENPDEVILKRTRRHFGFGRGIHFCVGAPLARLEARVVLKTLLEGTRSITLDRDCPPKWIKSVMVRRHEQLGVHLVPK